MPWLAPGCPRCGLWKGMTAPGLATCIACERNPPSFQHCNGLFEFIAPVDRMIRRFKDRQDFVAGRTLSRLLAEQFVRHHQETLRRLPAALVPVPLHPQRLGARGYNQSLMLARMVSRYTSLPVEARLCIRQQSTGDQRDLGRTARQKNVRTVFTAHPRRRSPVPGHVAIIDDVVTTGATASALARLLHNLGVRRIDVWCLARVEPPD